MWLIASDLHLTDAPRDEYRFGLFDYLIEQSIAHDVSDIFLLGDITDRKDNHSGVFINKIVDKFVNLFDMTKARIHILQGNHDYSDPENPTLGFLPLISGVDIRWYKPSDFVGFTITKSDDLVVMFPFCRYLDDFQMALTTVHNKEYAAAFFHQTFKGAKASSGMEMDGIPVGYAYKIDALRYFAGDIHVPQKVGKVEYVGSPYQIRFGDEFQGRVLAYDAHKDEVKELHYPTIKKRTLTIGDDPSALSNADIKEGDMIKVRMSLPQERTRDWKDIEAQVINAVKESGGVLYGVEITVEVDDGKSPSMQSESTAPAQVFDDFCASNNVDAELKKEGEAYL